MNSLRKVLETHKTIVLLGAGGVGKTTTSVALAFAGARLGLKVGLLSIDPARRLASALGIKMGKELEKISVSDESITGTIHAAMIDQKEVFDSMVHRHAPNEKVRNKILNHGLYKACSEYLGGAIEYMALAQLQDMIDSNEFDLVILDTPPAQHVIDFLRKPNILADFFESNVTKILLKPFVLASKFGLGKVMAFGEKMMGGLAKIAGIQSLELLAEFMILLQDVLAGFNKAGERIVSTLREPSTAFLTVVSPRRDAVDSGVSTYESIKTMDFGCSGFIWNRDSLQEIHTELESALKIVSDSSPLGRDLGVLNDQYLEQSKLFHHLWTYLKKDGVPLFKLQEMDHDIHSVEAMSELSNIILSTEEVLNA